MATKMMAGTMMMMVVMVATMLPSADALVGPAITTTKATTTTKNMAKSSRLFAATAGTMLPEGMLKTITRPGTGKAVSFGDTARINYSCYLVSDDKQQSSSSSVLPDGMPFSKGDGVRMMVGDRTMIEGWTKALPTMYVGERAIFRITDSDTLGYGEQGVPPIVPPNAVIELDIEMLDSKTLSFDIDFDALESSGVPTTPAEIAAAFEKSQLERSKLPPRKEGIGGIIERFETAYFFGFFDSETGEEAPWYLKPSITFPLAFAVVGAAFYVSLASGAITERGAEITDELDELVVAGTNVMNLLM